MTKAVQNLPHNAPFDVVALYAFTPIADPLALKAELRALGEAEELCGTLIVANEGFNGTLAGSRPGLERLVSHLQALLAPGRQVEIKFSHATGKPFGKLKIKVKREIVTLGVDGIDPSRMVGTYATPEEWNALIADPGTVIIDTRNSYEIAVGTFQNALDPHTQVFRQFPAWVAANRDRLEGKRIAMFCTGGIRCEKATALMKAEGFDDVHHLKGGILKYLEATPPGQSLWTGECFVFDERVTLAHGLAEGASVMCPECGTPIAAAALDAEANRCPDCVRAPLRAARQSPPNRR
ncbi:MAG: rhodanese-related sulfurtransferase [Phyllobacteriaceae bacterium]|nr:rhodanese-related sulfurtransferase [Phyllobacteriaceae bacterium]